jgi:hypothetical protein
MPIGTSTGDMIEYRTGPIQAARVASWFETRGVAALLTVRV